MESGESNGGELTLKRQRAPLSDSEDGVLSSSGKNYGQKRQRLERADQENRSPKPSSSESLAKQRVKPDTPAIQSVRSRVHQLAQKRDGRPVLAQKCLSDPGADVPEKGLKEHLLGEVEFNQRLERFKAPVFDTSATSSPTGSLPRPLSNFVSDIQQKLQENVTPSSKHASRIRQEREQELRLLRSQPISENAWLKRSSSDTSLVEGDGNDEIKDGSFSEALVSSVQKTPGDITELERCNEWQMEWKEPDTSKRTGAGEEKALEGFVKTFEDELGDDQPEDQSALELPLDEEQSISKVLLSENTTTSKAVGAPVLIEKGVSVCLSANESEGDSSYCDEGIELSTDEELRIWRYPPDMESREVESTLAGDEQGGTLYTGKNKSVSSIFEEKGTVSNVSYHSKQSDVEIGECIKDINEFSMFLETFEQKEDIDLTPKEEFIESDFDSVYSVKHQMAIVQYVESTICRKQEVEPHKTHKEQAECADPQKMKQDEETEQCTTEKVNVDYETQTGSMKYGEMDPEAEMTVPQSPWQQTGQSHEADGARVLMETLTGDSEFCKNMAYLPQAMLEAQASKPVNPADVNRGKRSQTLKEAWASDDHQMAEKMELDSVYRGQSDQDKLTYENQVEEVHRADGRGLKKVTFILEPELIDDSTVSEANTSFESNGESSLSEAGLSSHDETNTAEMIDKMFEEVLEYAGKLDGKRDDEDTEDLDSGIGTCSGDKKKVDMGSEKEKSEGEEEAKGEDGHWEDAQLDTTGDELLTFPPSGILSPLSKSVEAVVTPMRLAVSQLSTPSSLLLTPEELSTISPVDSAPLYSIDAYRTQRRTKLPTIETVTPAVQRQAPEKSNPQPFINTKDRIVALNEEAGKLQTVINQTLQALSCCTDEEHGRGSLEEAEAEKLLLVSCEKRSALLAEVARLREEGGSNFQKAKGEGDYVTQQPCRGTVSISNVQLPLKVEFVCSSRTRTGRPSHYFFVLIRYGPYNIVATPLATAADAQNGDTISFPTTVTLKDIRSNFEIDVEVYSLSQPTGNTCGGERISTKPRVTPRKLLNTITQRSNNSMTSAGLPAINMPRSSNFSLVGSHKITLASLGQSKFLLDKMKFEGKIRRLLGDEFQEKVPFLSPLEGNIYMRLASESHSSVQHQGFLTMFEVVNGFGMWHRRFFALEGYHMYYWNHPNDKETKAAEGHISLSSSPSDSVKAVKRDSCARPLTFELVSNINTQQQDDSQNAIAKCWFSADTKQEWSDWMDKLNQVLLDIHTWSRSPPAYIKTQEAKGSRSGDIRESTL